jgi:hypothetical protein
VSVTAGFGFSKYLPRRTAAVLDAGEASATGGPPLAFCRGDAGACGAINDLGRAPDFRVSGWVGLEVRWTEALSSTVDLVLWKTRKLSAGAPDERSSTVRDGDGRAVVDGVGESDQSWGTVETEYEIDDVWSVALGVSSLQPLKTRDGRALRFPFYDFAGPANNFTQWYLTVSAAL